MSLMEAVSSMPKKRARRPAPSKGKEEDGGGVGPPDEAEGDGQLNEGGDIANLQLEIEIIAGQLEDERDDARERGAELSRQLDGVRAQAAAQEAQQTQIIDLLARVATAVGLQEPHAPSRSASRRACGHAASTAAELAAQGGGRDAEDVIQDGEAECGKSHPSREFNSRRHGHRRRRREPTPVALVVADGTPGAAGASTAAANRPCCVDPLAA